MFVGLFFFSPAFPHNYQHLFQAKNEKKKLSRIRNFLYLCSYVLLMSFGPSARDREETKNHIRAEVQAFLGDLGLKTAVSTTDHL